MYRELRDGRWTRGYPKYTSVPMGKSMTRKRSGLLNLRFTTVKGKTQMGKTVQQSPIYRIKQLYIAPYIALRKVVLLIVYTCIYTLTHKTIQKQFHDPFR